ncbi:M28 family peptidase [Capnocytophaga sp. ARDL2]|uniref:M28 family peptidase n=1 Tax=Capnocytophaga sp. ARDL2 TaxID=3238809 RepID=UPI0035577F1B
MKKIIFSLLILGQMSFAQQAVEVMPPAEAYARSISLENLKEHLFTLASDEYEGRKTGEKGQKMAAEYIRDFYKKHNIPALPGTEDYFQFVPSKFMKRLFSHTLNDSENVIAYLKGSGLPEEYIVISAHYDHIGMSNNEIFNGADDNASGTTGILELARILKKASDEGFLRRSVIFLHCTGEEYGLHGSRYFSQNSLIPLETIKANFNIDMIGRIDYKYKDNGDYLYLVGSLDEGKHLYQFAEDASKYFVNLTLDYTYDDRKHPEKIFYRSDHYNFARHGIPVLFFYSGEHDDYHQATDTADKIEYDTMKKRLHLIFHTIWKTINQ